MKLLRKLLSPVSRLVKKDLVVFCETHHGSGSNVFALYSAFAGDSSIGFDCHLVCRDAKGLRERIRLEALLMRAKWIVQDHGGNRSYPGQKVIELWHGIPIKAMELMDANDQSSRATLALSRTLPDAVLSSSRLYETLLSACRGIPAPRYHRFGFPRLRWLKTDRSKARRLLGEMLGQKFSGADKVILWMPTHRRLKSRDSAQDRSVIPALMERYLTEDLESKLEACNAWLILKPHPNDEPAARRLVRQFGSRVRILTSDALGSRAEDLYCLLPGTDALITDYSSVYFDYLLLDRPIGFIVDDLEQYRRERGFLLEPVTDWMPGFRIRTTGNLHQFLDDLGNENDEFREERASLRKAFFPEGIVDTAALVKKHLLG